MMTHFGRATFGFQFHSTSVMKLFTTATSAILLAFITPSQVSAHCQVPCGIYSDETVLTDLQTHQATIAKAMKQITELSKDPTKNANQLVRWINNKEKHADKIQTVMTQYFLAQRIKLAEAETNKKAYLKKLTLSHQIIVLSMKCKQSTDPAVAEKLHQAIHDFTAAYKAH